MTTKYADSETHGLKYVGKGATYAGVPTRDLTAGEVASLGPRERRIVNISGAWRPFTEKEAGVANPPPKEPETPEQSGKE